MNYIDRLQVNPGLLRLIRTVGMVFFLVHLMACAFFFTSKIAGFPIDCWVVMRGIVEDPAEE